MHPYATSRNLAYPSVENVMKYKLQSQMVFLEDCFSEINSRVEVVSYFGKQCLKEEHPAFEDLQKNLERISQLAEKGNRILDGEYDGT